MFSRTERVQINISFDIAIHDIELLRRSRPLYVADRRRRIRA
jgi:hypothetical protein